MTWQERIDKAKIKNKFTKDDHLTVGSWATCAVGEIFGPGIKSALPKHLRDTRVSELGMEFMVAVQMNSIDKAQEILTKLKEMNVERKGSAISKREGV